MKKQSKNEERQRFEASPLKYWKVCVVLLLALVFFSSLIVEVSGLGISPASKTVNFEPEASIPLEFNLINSEQADVEVALSASGEYAGFLFFEDNLLGVSSSEYRVPFRARLEFPQELKPGVHTVFLTMTPKPASSGSTFSAFVSPSIPINIRVPYPSKYAEVSIGTFDVDEGTPMPVSLEFDNLGTEDIASASGSAKVLSPDKVVLAEVFFPSITVSSNSFAKSEGTPRLILRSGEYSIDAVANYDGEEVLVSKNFSLGIPTARIASVETKSVPAGRISQVKMKVFLEWNKPLDANAFVTLEGAKVELPDFTLAPQAEVEITGFVDAANAAPGDYLATLELVYANKIESITFPIKVVQPGFIDLSTASGNTFLLILTAVLVIALLVAVYFFLFKKDRGKKKEGDGEGNERAEPGGKEETG